MKKLLVLVWIVGFVCVLRAADFQRVLFLGNSITLHSPKADIGWTGNWGMAASAAEKDYVHLVTRGLIRKDGTEPATMVRNIAAFERAYGTYDTATLVKETAAFSPDLIVLAIGENVQALKNAASQALFAEKTASLLKSIKGDSQPKIVVRSCFWANGPKDEALESVCREVGGVYVDIRALGKDEKNYARSEREFQHKGVAAHPGDRGMRAIADAILGALGVGGGDAASKPRIKLGAYYFAGWAGKSEYDDGTPEHAWAKGMPTHFTKKLATEYAGRTPIWGWRDDTLELMERQIDLAADNGVAHFSFCWYWHDNKAPINRVAIEQDSKHLPMRLFMQAKNNNRMEFSLLVANHGGFEIVGLDAWKQAADYWITLFKHPRYLRMEGKPVIMIFLPQGAEKAGLDYLQAAAKKAGFPGVWVAGCGAGTPAEGFGIRTVYNSIPDKDAEQKPLNLTDIYPFRMLADWNVSVWTAKDRPDVPYIPVVTQGWDRRPWEAKNGEGLGEGSGVSPHFARGTPQELEAYLSRMADWMDANPKQATPDRLSLIYAWNEIGEGGWLVPCKDDPDGAYLKVIRKVVFGH